MSSTALLTSGDAQVGSDIGRYTQCTLHSALCTSREDTTGIDARQVTFTAEISDSSVEVQYVPVQDCITVGMAIPFRTSTYHLTMGVGGG